MHFYDHHAYIVLCLSVVCPIPPIPGVQWEIEGKLTCPNAIPGAQSHVLSPYTCIPFKYPISPCCAQCVKGRYGCLNRTIPTKYPPLGEDFGGKFPFHQHLPQVCHGTRWGIQTTGKARYVSALRDKCRR